MDDELNHRTGAAARPRGRPRLRPVVAAAVLMAAIGPSQAFVTNSDSSMRRLEAELAAVEVAIVDLEQCLMRPYRSVAARQRALRQRRDLHRDYRELRVSIALGRLVRSFDLSDHLGPGPTPGPRPTAEVR